MNTFIVLVIVLFTLLSITLYLYNRDRQVHIWIMAYLNNCFSSKPAPSKEGPIHVMFSIMDHYEPYQDHYNRFSGPMEIVKYWQQHLPGILNKHADSNGRMPQYGFFYPAEAYDKDVVEEIAVMCRGGYGDMDVHLHHDDDTADNMEKVILNFIDTLYHDHGMLRKDENGKITFGFIHGDWALDNSAAGGHFCGINDELLLLKKLGCYADFTLPSAPSETQTSKINSIYYAKDDPNQPKSHNMGKDVSVNGEAWGDLMIIQGPLTLNWKNRKFGLFPRIENGELSAESRPSKQRALLWIQQHIHVTGSPNIVFIKLHAHGANERGLKMLLDDGGLDQLYSIMEEEYNDGKNYKLHYVTPYEIYKTIKALEGGFKGDPTEVYNNK